MLKQLLNKQEINEEDLTKVVGGSIGGGWADDQPHCPICGGEVEPYILNAKRSEVYLCLTCGKLFENTPDDPGVLPDNPAPRFK